MENKIKAEPYNSIEEVIADVEALGDWRDPAEKDAFFIVLSKVAAVHKGYTLDGKEVTRYPDEVLESICMVLKSKFPSEHEPFDKNGDLKPGLPEYSNYLACATIPLYIDFLCERADMGYIAMTEYDIDINKTRKTQEQVDAFSASCKEYLKKANQSQPS